MTNEPMISRHSATTLLGTLIAGALVLAPSARAQDLPTAADLERACLALEPQLMQLASAPSTLAALSQMQTCPDVGPMLLAARWQQPPTDVQQLWRWVENSVTILDERIFETMLGIVADRTRPRSVRLAALSVATYHADPAYVRRFGDVLIESPVPPDARGPIKYLAYSLVSSTGRSEPAKGAQAVVGNPQQRLISVLQGLMQTVGEDEIVKAAGRSLLHGLFKVHVQSNSQPIDTAFVRTFRRGETTMGEVEARLGPPQATRQSADSVVWYYSYWEINRPTTSAARDSRTMSQILSITFVDGRIVTYGNRLPGR